MDTNLWYLRKHRERYHAEDEIDIYIDLEEQARSDIKTYLDSKRERKPPPDVSNKIAVNGVQVAAPTKTEIPLGETSGVI